MADVVGLRATLVPDFEQGTEPNWRIRAHSPGYKCISLRASTIRRKLDLRSEFWMLWIDGPPVTGARQPVAERLAQTMPRAGAMVIATHERVKNTRRIIAQSRQLLQRARQTLESSKLLRVALKRPSETKP